MIVAIVVAVLVVLAMLAMRSERHSNTRRLQQLSAAVNTQHTLVVWPVLEGENIMQHVQRATQMMTASSNPFALFIGTNSPSFGNALIDHWQTCGLTPLAKNVRMCTFPSPGTKEAARASIMEQLFAHDDFVLHTDPLYLRFLPQWDADLATAGGIVSFVPQPHAPAEFGPPNPETLTSIDSDCAFVDTQWVCSMFLFAPAAMLVDHLHDPWQNDDIKATSWQWSIKLALCPVLKAPTRQIVQGPLMKQGPCNKRRLQAALGRLGCDICGKEQGMHTTEYALGHDYTLVSEERNLPNLKHANSFYTTGL